MGEERTFEIIFHNWGLRSWIECTLCWNCPRGDNKGCCYYNPTFYPLDFVYIMEKKPELIEDIFSRRRITVMEKYVGVDRIEDADGDFRCQFHSLEGGCELPPDLRESVCREYVCPGCGVWEIEGAGKWKEFFERLGSFEQEINSFLSRSLELKGLTLKNNWADFIVEAGKVFREVWPDLPYWMKEYPAEEKFVVRRAVVYGKDWKI